MSKKSSKNAGSFLLVADIEKGVVVDKFKIPKTSFKRFTMQTNLMKVDLKNIFIVDDTVRDILDLKIGKK